MGQDAASEGHHCRNTNVVANWVGSVGGLAKPTKISVDTKRKMEVDFSLLLILRHGDNGHFHRRLEANFK